MNATTETPTTRFHTSLNVSVLSRSTDFYRALFGLEPAKQRSDYAKFELDEPPLVLSLIPGRPAPGGNLNHVGLRVRDSEELVRIQHRLEAAGISTNREDGVECCYSKQTKFWVNDPDRTLWEIYVFHEGSEKDDDHPAPTAARVESFARDVPRDRVVWQHQLTEPVPERIPHADNSVHEILLEGTANLKPGAANLDALLAEAFRVLRPGGEVRLHGLAGDAPLPDIPLTFPGPAAAVQYVPPFIAPLQALRRAGFVDVCFDKLSARAHFEVAGVGLREVLLVARKPGHRPRVASHTAIYLGPLAEVADDYGNIFPRGARVALNVHDWLSLKNGSAAGQFLLLTPNSTK